MVKLMCIFDFQSLLTPDLLFKVCIGEISLCYSAGGVYRFVPDQSISIQNNCESININAAVAKDGKEDQQDFLTTKMSMVFKIPKSAIPVTARNSN
jgi:hypothetical protein